MVFKVTTGICSDNHMKHLSALCGLNIDLNLTVGAICSYPCDLEVSGLCYDFYVYMYVCM